MFQEDLLNSCPKRPTRSSAPVQVRSQREKGTHTFVCGRIEFSDHYERNCRYCGLHSANPTPHRHHLAEGAIFESGTYRNTTVLQSGGIHEDQQHLAHIVDALRIRLPATAVPLNVGEHPADSYILWKADTPFPKLHAARGGCHHGAPGMEQVFVTL